jgi:hypothetical protein
LLLLKTRPLSDILRAIELIQISIAILSKMGLNLSIEALSCLAASDLHEDSVVLAEVALEEGLSAEVGSEVEVVDPMTVIGATETMIVEVREMIGVVEGIQETIGVTEMALRMRTLVRYALGGVMAN